MGYVRCETRERSMEMGGNGWRYERNGAKSASVLGRRPIELTFQRPTPCEKEREISDE